MERARSAEIKILSGSAAVSLTLNEKSKPVGTGECSVSYADSHRLGRFGAERRIEAHFSPFSNYVLVDGRETSSGGALLSLIPKQNLLPVEVPIEHQPSDRWLSYVGKDPSLPSIVTFGSPEPLVEVRYLGHPDHHIAALMLNMAKDPDNPMDREVIAHSCLFDGLVRTYGCGRASVEYDAKCMVYAEARKGWNRFSIATIAYADNLLRINHGDWHRAHHEEPDYDKLCSRLADQISSCDESGFEPEKLLVLSGLQDLV